MQPIYCSICAIVKKRLYNQDTSMIIIVQSQLSNCLYNYIIILLIATVSICMDKILHNVCDNVVSTVGLYSI